MKKIKKRNIFKIICIALIIAIVYPYTGVRFSTNPKVQEGDVIFQSSKSRQSPLISAATLSPITHCGVIVIKGGEPYVLEASSTLKVTPLKEFIKRGRWGAYWIKHPKDMGNMHIRYRHLLGRSYDLAFSFNNNKYYCSELVYDIYKYQLGVELCEPKPMKSYITWGMKKVMIRRGMNPDDLVVAPSDLFKSNKLS